MLLCNEVREVEHLQEFTLPECLERIPTEAEL
jgi:hypothetical protein